MRYRKQIRLKDYDYSMNGYYFVTLCTKNRLSLFEADDAKSLICQKLEQIPKLYSGVKVDIAVVMPDHIHMILVFDGASKSLSYIIQAFKSWITREKAFAGKSIWQANYYEHVIRNEVALMRIREYIQNNPSAEGIDFDQFYL